MLWRLGIFAIGLIWLVCAGADVHRIVTEGGVLGWTLGLVHGVFFLLMGLATCVAAVLVDGATARRTLGEFAGAVFSAKNLREVAWMLTIAIAAAWVLVMIRHN